MGRPTEILFFPPLQDLDLVWLSKKKRHFIIFVLFLKDEIKAVSRDTTRIHPGYERKKMNSL